MVTEAQRRELVDKLSRLVADRFGGDYGRAFEHYDRDKKDGRIDRDELGHLLRDAGGGNRLTRGAWVARIIRALDADKGGTISAEEFQDAIR